MHGWWQSSNTMLTMISYRIKLSDRHDKFVSSSKKLDKQIIGMKKSYQLTICSLWYIGTLNIKPHNVSIVKSSCWDIYYRKTASLSLITDIIYVVSRDSQTCIITTEAAIIGRCKCYCHITNCPRHSIFTLLRLKH